MINKKNKIQWIDIEDIYENLRKTQEEFYVELVSVPQNKRKKIVTEHWGNIKDEIEQLSSITALKNIAHIASDTPKKTTKIKALDFEELINVAALLAQQENYSTNYSGYNPNGANYTNYSSYNEDEDYSNYEDYDGSSYKDVYVTNYGGVNFAPHNPNNSHYSGYNPNGTNYTNYSSYNKNTSNYSTYDGSANRTIYSEGGNGNGSNDNYGCDEDWGDT